MKCALEQLFNSNKYKKIQTVLEFGAAKLKNIPYILKCGKDVTAVEFEKLMENEITKATREECEKYGKRFKSIQFPNPFIFDDKKYDLGLLLNVLPTMPIPAERLYVLNLLHEKVKNDKYLLWIAFRETREYKDIGEAGTNECGDGIWVHKDWRYKTFYKYHPLEELDELMGLFGFDKIDITCNEVRLYQKNKYNIMGDLVTPERICRYIPENTGIEDPVSVTPKIVEWTSEIKPVIPNPPELQIENLYIEKLGQIQHGTKDAEVYHRFVSYALSRIFRGQLRNMKMKKDIRKGTGIIDTLFLNSADKGFFHNIKSSQYDCTHPIVEVKNIEGDPENNEINQLYSRFSPQRGNFGLLICRKIDDPESVLERCASKAHTGAMLVLCDDDIRRLMEYRRDGELENIDDLMDDKWTDLTYAS